MKIIHLSYTEKGGAGIATQRLNSALNKIDGISSQFISYDKVRQSSLFNRLYASWNWRVNEKILYKNFKAYRFWSPLSGFSYEQLKPFVMAADIIHLHWIGRFVSYNALRSLSQIAPLVWTIHDRNPMMSIFHYALERQKYIDEIGQEERLLKLNNKKRDLVKAVPINRLTYVSPSKIYQGELKQAEITKSYPSISIANGVPCDQFQPEKGEKDPSRKKVLLFNSIDIQNKYKGGQILIEALSKLKNDYKIIMIGNGPELKLPFESLYTGYIEDPTSLSKYYASADLCLCPTLEDNFPNTILESLACGIPVIGSNIGGVSEMVRPNITGDLFKVGDPIELAQKIEAWFKRSDLEKISRNCRDIAVKEYDTSIQAIAYVRLYRRIMEKNHEN